MRLQPHGLEDLVRRLTLALELARDLVLALAVLALAQLLQVGLVGPVGDAKGADLLSRSHVRIIFERCVYAGPEGGRGRGG